MHAPTHTHIAPSAERRSSTTNCYAFCQMQQPQHAKKNSLGVSASRVAGVCVCVCACVWCRNCLPGCWSSAGRSGERTHISHTWSHIVALESKPRVQNTRLIVPEHPTAATTRRYLRLAHTHIYMSAHERARAHAKVGAHALRRLFARRQRS